MAEYRVSSSEMMVVFRELQTDANVHYGHESTQDEIKNTQDKVKNTQDNTQDNIQDEVKNTQDNTQENALTDKARRILIICEEPKSKQEIAELLGYKTIKSVKTEIDALLRLGRLNMTIPNKPSSRNQKYIAVK